MSKDSPGRDETTPQATLVPAARGVPWTRWVVFWTIAVGGLAFDLATKSAIFAEVGPPGPLSYRSVIGDVVELRTSYNEGALWGFGGSWEYASLVFALLSVAAVGFILYWLFVAGHARDWRLTIALALIMAGALGNCHDRLRYGKVRDFVHVHVDSIGFNFPIFNFADNFLVLGAAVLIWMAMRDAGPEPARVESTVGTGSAA